jgi:hypothetical protein
VLTGALAIAAAGALAGCTGGENGPGSGGATTTITPAATTAPPEGDAALAAAALGDELALLDYCTTAVARSRGTLRRRLVPVRQRQQAIVVALTDAMTEPTASPRPPITVPRQEPALLRTLARLQTSAETARLEDCLAAESGLLARLLASVSASHAVAVEQVRSL